MPYATDPAAPRDSYSVPELTMAWGRGWAVSRGTSAPVGVPGGFRVDVGLPGHRVRHVLHTHDADVLGRLGRKLTAPGNWIKACGDPDEFRSALPDGWTMDTAGYLMTVRFREGAARPQPGYAVRVDTDPDSGVVVATVLDRAGEKAASGRLAPAGEFGIVDKVETEPNHRRRGLGTVVMRTLADRAAADGMRTGILVATDDGRALYRSLGWTVRSDVAGAFRPGGGKWSAGGTGMYRDQRASGITSRHDATTER
ncbi:GNAT family N-acetyltransferase [Plantactinospora sp. S1510]|uniref:GNAT family N-acetyltransferase n=1 Tax=Plantactinospora alkalitolerans TaxID=2789879 RepID=A0ABS0H1F0_9ACTN|nr:GNAT family N-acetyltransferase [Plantactinospora alkalitolerans]MBF9132287.1 GNAT family N-acetyltransferase [Plantactinospora alkalitolerans]